MKTDYITAGTPMPSHLIYPRFLLGASVRFTAKEVYVILLDMTPRLCGSWRMPDWLRRN